LEVRSSLISIKTGSWIPVKQATFLAYFGVRQKPKPYRQLNPAPSILDPFKPVIDAILTWVTQASLRGSFSTFSMAARAKTWG
jgi:hypothetical protein